MRKMGEQKLTNESIPLLCEGTDLNSLQVDAREGFIISRLDGHTKVEHIISMSGLGREETIQILEGLLEKGIICLHEGRKDAREKKKEEAIMPDARGSGDPVKEEPEDGAQVRKRSAPAGKRQFVQIPEGEAFFKWIDRLHDELDNIDYFELLGVDSRSTTKEIKKAYFRRSKIFHPDRFYRKAEPEVLRKLQEVFKRSNMAFKVLSSEEKRKEYENKIKSKGPGRKLTTLSVAAKIEEEELKKKHPDLPKLSLDFEGGGKKRKEEELLKKLKDSPYYESIKKAQRFYEGAMLEIRKKNLGSARTNLKLAMQYDPMNSRYQEELERIDALEFEMQAEVAFGEGLSAEAAKDYSRAVTYFQNAVRHKPQNPEYLYKLAEAVLKYQNNFDRARSLCLKAVELKAGDARFHMVLGQAYKGLGQMGAAKVQFEKVLQLEPKNKQANKELKAIKKS